MKRILLLISGLVSSSEHIRDVIIALLKKLTPEHKAEILAALTAVETAVPQLAPAIETAKSIEQTAEYVSGQFPGLLDYRIDIPPTNTNSTTHP